MDGTNFILYAGGASVIILTSFLCYLIYSIAKLVSEGNKTVADVNKKLEKIDPVFDETTKTLVDLNESIQAINNGILKPIASVASVFRGVKQAISTFQESKGKGKKEK